MCVCVCVCVCVRVHAHVSAHMCVQEKSYFSISVYFYLSMYQSVPGH